MGLGQQNQSWCETQLMMVSAYGLMAMPERLQYVITEGSSHRIDRLILGGQVTPRRGLGATLLSAR